MPFNKRERYIDLSEKIRSRPTDYKDVANEPRNNPVLGRLEAGYSANTYWSRLFHTTEVDTYQYWTWDKLVPIHAYLAERPQWIEDAHRAFKVSPIVRVLLYPFGWSTWVSLLVTRSHALHDIAELNQRCLKEPVFRWRGLQVSVNRLFQEVAADIRTDVFGKDDAELADPLDVISVTTVLAKHGGSPALGGLSKSERQELLGTVRPPGAPTKDDLDGHVYRIDPDSNTEYILHNRNRRFIWLEHLLSPVGRNQQHLRCYHENTFRSLLHACHCTTLLSAASKAHTRRRIANTELLLLLRSAIAVVEDPPLERPGRYKNASLVEFWVNPATVAIVRKARAFVP
jgi:hypothetical protein